MPGGYLPHQNYNGLIMDVFLAKAWGGSRMLSTAFNMTGRCPRMCFTWAKVGSNGACQMLVTLLTVR